MRAIIVTSAVTFVPENYDQMVLGVADHPSIVGLLVLDNREWSQPLKALALILTLSSPRLGWHLLKNFIGFSLKRRKEYYRKINKKFWLFKSINSTEVLQLIKDQQIDLIINARTRFIYKEAVLQAPKYGCINIHHGLLPTQRGLMCDFWAHLENQPFGFTVHQMTKKIDDGPIIEVVQNILEPKNFCKSIFESSKLEAQTCKTILDYVEKTSALPIKEKDYNPLKSILGDKIIYRKNPSLIDGYRLKIKGVQI